MKRKILVCMITILIMTTMIFLNIYSSDKLVINENDSNNIAIMVYDKVENEYVHQNNIPIGNYFLNEELSYCEGKGRIGSYNKNLGKVTVMLVGNDKCYYYFDEQISFTIDGVTYYASDGSTWSDWVNSSNNTGDFVLEDNTYIAKMIPNDLTKYVYTNTSEIVNMNASDTIVAGSNYSLDSLIFQERETAGQYDVYVLGSNIDFGIQNSDNTEYYTSSGKQIYDIYATKDNVTIIGNQYNNTITIKGGTNNTITGLLQNDTYIFKSGGGVITDFGINATYACNGTKITYAKTTIQQEVTGTSSYYAYDRTNPLSYYEGNDYLYVYGTITSIYIPDCNTSANQKQTISATIYYTGEDGNNYTIELHNMTKKSIKCSSNYTYQGDKVAAQTMSLYDTHETPGTFTQVSGSYLSGLFTT